MLSIDLSTLTQKTAALMDGVLNSVVDLLPRLASKDLSRAQLIINSNEYKCRKDVAILNFKIGAFNLLSLILITQVSLLALGALAITAELLTSLALSIAIRHVLGHSIDNNLGPIRKILNSALCLFTDSDSSLGGSPTLGFLRTFTPLGELSRIYQALIAEENKQDKTG